MRPERILNEAAAGHDQRWSIATSRPIVRTCVQPLPRGKSLKIVQAVEWYYPDGAGGTEGYVSGLCRKIRDAGHEVCVAAPDPGQDRPRTYWHDGVAVFRYPIPNEPTRGECQGRITVRGTEHFHEWLKEQEPNIVHFHTFGTGLGLHEIKAAEPPKLASLSPLTRLAWAFFASAAR